MLQLGLRLGPSPRALVTTTPRPGEALTRIMADPDTIITTGATRANPHTPAAWKGAVHRLYAGTHLGAQELEGKLLTDAPGALWTVELLEKCRLNPPLHLQGRGTMRSMVEGPSEARFLSGPSTTWTRIIIGVDPPSGGGTCGIIVCAKDEHGLAYVLADHSVTNRSPEGWARAVADAAQLHSSPAFAGEGDHAPKPQAQADGGAAGGEAAGGRASSTPSIPTLIVAEANQGGRMVKSVLHTADPNLHVKPVTARADKSTAPSRSPTCLKPARSCCTAASKPWKPNSSASSRVGAMRGRGIARTGRMRWFGR
jgi:phage terminase large subunit-like protein